MELGEATFSKKTVFFFVGSDAVLKSILGEREVFVTLPNITVLKTAVIEQLFGGTNSSKF